MVRDVGRLPERARGMCDSGGGREAGYTEGTFTACGVGDVHGTMAWRRRSSVPSANRTQPPNSSASVWDTDRETGALWPGADLANGAAEAGPLARNGSHPAANRMATASQRLRNGGDAAEKGVIGGAAGRNGGASERNHRNPKWNRNRQLRCT
jgi:hypothetical protein